MNHNLTLDAFLFAVGVGLCVKFVSWCIAQETREVTDVIKKRTHRHVHNRHGGSPNKCTHDECVNALIDITELTI